MLNGLPELSRLLLVLGLFPKGKFPEYTIPDLVPDNIPSPLVPGSGKHPSGVELRLIKASLMHYFQLFYGNLHQIQEIKVGKHVGRETSNPGKDKKPGIDRLDQEC